MKDRKTLGFAVDARVSAANKMEDPRATDRIVESIDWELVEHLRNRRIEAALSLLPRHDREFAERVLGGMTWHRSKYGKRGFNNRLQKILKKILCP